jgi:synaptobrevin family protein YKT6
VFDVSPLSYFQRTTAKEFITFYAQIVANAAATSTARLRVEEHGYVLWAHRRDHVTLVMVTDNEYPLRAAFSAIAQLMTSPPSSVNGWTEALAAFQDAKADKLTMIQQQLDQTMVIMKDNIESVLQRGDKLEDLMAKSTDLSDSSKQFYKTAKKHNQCCGII